MFVHLTSMLLILFAAVAGCQRDDRPQPAKPAAAPAGSYEHVANGAPLDVDPTHPVDVQVTKPVRQTLRYTVTLPANISPLYQTTLYAKVSGYLKWIGPDKGDAVKKDQVVAIIDAPEVEEQYQQAVADYKIRKLTHRRLADVWRESPDVIAKQDVDVAEAAYESAKNVMQQRAAMRNYTKVRAPYDGIVTARFADPGALIQVATSSATNAIPLFTIMDLDTVRVYTNVPQDDAPWIVPGKTHATLLVKELTGRSYSGAVTRSTLALDPSTRSLLVEIDIPNPDHALRPGTYAEVVLALREIPNALVLPPQAIVSGPKGKAVFIVDQGKAKSVPVQTGITDGQWIEVLSGLTGEEDVVVVGKRRLLEGLPVQAAPFKLPEAKPSQQKFERRSPGPFPQPAPSATAPHEPGVAR
ncbi:efflux RND transporter periplasmic adaptor subunit [Nitrospira moscoviensis]|uniref:Putative Membrane-fusion protein of multidrug efflux transporter n=1 Tax=Nitrospira moscoviensis TaxID=42253 RepID=A0A0K2GAD8_NITMO|nr:efflux RND transporter periplasmic adaptor subunit [Nitrospira moscoviensis]ALA57903.1 putative Membrane-fusion protein of multidrug efflux transporter [Nitrospira moscoviensis]